MLKVPELGFGVLLGVGCRMWATVWFVSGLSFFFSSGSRAELEEALQILIRGSNNKRGSGGNGKGKISRAQSQ